MDANQVLREVAAQVAVCTRCQLHLSRKLAVPGEGPAGAEVMCIGEGPGYYENEQGRPFVGAAGNLLNELLKKGGLSRAEVFITNVVKCRPPGNRDPLPEELAMCGDYLTRQIAAINPLVIVTLGRFSMQRFLPLERISQVHGQAVQQGSRLIVPMYHPAAALHQPGLKSTLERDFASLSEHLQKARARRAEAAAPPPVQAPPPPPAAEEPPQQLSLF